MDPTGWHKGTTTCVVTAEMGDGEGLTRSEVAREWGADGTRKVGESTEGLLLGRKECPESAGDSRRRLA